MGNAYKYLIVSTTENLVVRVEDDKQLAQDALNELEGRHKCFNGEFKIILIHSGYFR